MKAISLYLNRNRILNNHHKKKIQIKMNKNNKKKKNRDLLKNKVCQDSIAVVH